MNIIERIRSGQVSELELLDYITSNDFSIALAAAESPFASPSVLQIASHDNDSRIRLAALKNENIPTKAILFLCNDPDPFIAALAKEEAERRGL